jgi:glutamate dehydrogenase/leucine dehydrogenase
MIASLTKRRLSLTNVLQYFDASFQPKARGVIKSIHHSEEEPSFLHMVKTYFDQAGRYTNISKDVLEVYKNCNRVIKINLPLVRENGKIEYVTSYRAQHKHHR